MERQTFARALHAWDDWHKSIEKSRVLLGYNPKRPKKVNIKWIEGHYPRIRDLAEDELKRLELPLTLREYWEDCFYSDYRTKDKKTIYDKITRRLAKKESKHSATVPQLPCDHGVVWYDNEDIHDPWLRVEIRLHARFATKELFNYATKLAYDTIQSHCQREEIKPHPVCQWLKGGRPPIDGDLAIECARLKDDERWIYKEIGRKYKWALQEDSHGDLNQCSTARRYVKWGRELRKKYQS